MILCLMQFVPARRAPGGGQRALFLLESLARIGPVDLAIVHAPAHAPADDAALDAARAIARRVVAIPVPEWQPLARRVPRLPKRIGTWLDMARCGTLYAPRFAGPVIDRIAAALPESRPEVLFAGRSSMAEIADSMIRRGGLAPAAKIVDLDDIQSRFLVREARATLHAGAIDRWLSGQAQAALVRRSERRIAASWGAVGVCSDEDAATLGADHPGARIAKVPNVVERPALGPPPADGFNLLFVGNLGFGPNTHGLSRFVEGGWPIVRAAIPHARFRVVGMAPPPGLAEKLAAAGIELHADVPSLEPYYADAHAVVAPILFGGGTRIKILEAMAYGRAVVSTTIGAEGLGLAPGRHALIADTMAEMADAVVSLARDPALRDGIAADALAYQHAAFGPDAMATAIAAMVAMGRDQAAG